MIENLICNRVVAHENNRVMTAEFTASPGVAMTMKLDLDRYPVDGPDRPLQGAVYHLVPRDGAA